MTHVGRKREHRHVGRDRTHKKVHVVTGNVEWDKNAPEDVKRFEVIQMYNPRPRLLTPLEQSRSDAGMLRCSTHRDMKPIAYDPQFGYVCELTHVKGRG